MYSDHYYFVYKTELIDVGRDSYCSQDVAISLNAPINISRYYPFNCGLAIFVRFGVNLHHLLIEYEQEVTVFSDGTDLYRIKN